MGKDNLTYKINIAEAFALAFGKGQIPLQYKIDAESETSNTLLYSGVKAINSYRIEADKSWMGTPIAFKFSFGGGRYNAYDLHGNIEERELAEFQLPLSTTVEFTRSKNIRTTITAGGYGSVKEMYGFTDWQIRIRGICLDDPGHPQFESAIDQRKALAAFEDLADAIAIVPGDNVFSDLGIYKLVIKSISFPSVVGKSNYFPFQLNCVSDTPLELILT